MNTWPGGRRKTLTQAEHEAWNRTNYPGTLQICALCGEPTGRCEEDAIWNEEGEPICESCNTQPDNAPDEKSCAGD